MIDTWLTAALWAWIGGLGIPLGGLLYNALSPKLSSVRGLVNHFMTALGGGALLSAVALVLVPDGMEKQSAISGVLTFILGGIAFAYLDKLVHQFKGGGPQVVAMVSDFIPEAMALGAVYIEDPNQAYLLAGIMLLQNVSEGYNAYMEFVGSSVIRKRAHTLKILFAISVLGPICAAIGSEVLAETPHYIGMLMTISGGGITYLIFRDIAPASNIKNNYFIPLGSIIGFAIGLLGWSLVN